MQSFKTALSHFLFRTWGHTGQWYRQHLADFETDADTLYEIKLTHILKYAYEHVPYYRNIMKHAGIDQIDEITAATIHHLPTLTKDIIRCETTNLISDKQANIPHFSNYSGGSTGEPVQFLQSMDFKYSARVTKIIMDDMLGYHVGQRKLLLWGSERDLFHNKEPLPIRIQKFIKNEFWFNSFNMSDKKYEQCIHWIQNNSPKMILAYVESIYELSKLINKKHLNVPSPKVIMTTAGTLTDDFYHEIQQAFPCSIIANRYGSREVGDIACYHPLYQKLVVFHPTQYVEIIDKNGNHVKKGEIGDVVVTNLTNKIMPLIRFKIGDVARYGGTINGKIILERVLGRTSDFFINTNKEKVHGEYFTHLFYGKNWVKNFQVVQKKTDAIELNLSVDKEIFNEIELDDIKDKIRLVMGKDCHIQTNFLKKIPPTKSGKYRYTISEVN